MTATRAQLLEIGNLELSPRAKIFRVLANATNDVFAEKRPEHRTLFELDLGGALSTALGSEEMEILPSEVTTVCPSLSAQDQYDLVLAYRRSLRTADELPRA